MGGKGVRPMTRPLPTQHGCGDGRHVILKFLPFSGTESQGADSGGMVCLSAMLPYLEDQTPAERAARAEDTSVRPRRFSLRGLEPLLHVIGVLHGRPGVASARMPSWFRGLGHF
ncbi:hypothetical protein NHX12_007455 [Muraenolepis orangiensis]|uniref:Uncharacterized protein n=1 Tax=Muraenolepis orangiensis TaxID=630683 RepID=A0A9Q0DPZ7_9TELE|nr:hypothetical protein NHX12_007455 [Muraenolepis orangiensis]